MRPIHIRKRRSTLKDAHLVASGKLHSGMGAEDYLSDEERSAEVEKVKEELLNTVRRNFPRTKNLEYAVLKSHLIVEHALTQFIRCSFQVLVDIEDLNFRFSQKVTLAYLCGLTDAVMLPSIELLNRARNQVGHKFNLDRGIIDELIRINSEQYVNMKALSDVERIRGLRTFCYSLCGELSGFTSARVITTKNHRTSGPEVMRINATGNSKNPKT